MSALQDIPTTLIISFLLVTSFIVFYTLVLNLSDVVS